MMRYSLLICALLFILSMLSLGYGPVNLAPLTILKALLGPMVGAGADETTRIIVQELRLPRLLLSLSIGAGLGLSGAALQGLLRNPLADPGILGISAASSMGAVFAIHYGLTAIFAYALPVTAMVAAVTATLIIFWFANREHSHLTLILTGVALSSLCGAVTSLLINLAPSPVSMQEMVMWMLGSLENRSRVDVMLALPFMLAGGILLFSQKRPLSALALGEEVACSMGINLRRVTLCIILGSAMIVGAGVAVAGMIGFIGLVTPHLVRPFVGYDPGKTMLPSALIGAILLTLADILVRTPLLYTELKIGVLTALLGAPFFLVIVLKSRREMR